MNQPTAPASSANGHSAPEDIFALTDEQILEIEPENGTATSPPSEPHPESVIPSESALADESRDRGKAFGPARSRSASQDSSSPSVPRNDRMAESAPLGVATGHGTQVTEHATPPSWLAEAMNDPQRGGEARSLWEGAQKAQGEAAAYREVFATPEDARALKTLYPGGVSEARAAADRAQLLNEIDRAYFGVAGNSPEQTSAARAQLAATMLREDPAAFREMVIAGLRALGQAEKGSVGAANLATAPRLAQVFAANGNQLDVASRLETGASAAGSSPQTLADAGLKPGAIPLVGATLGSPALNAGNTSTGGASPAPTSLVGPQHVAPHLGTAQLGNTSATESQAAAYAAFEKAANEDLERSVGVAIQRTIAQALPNLKRSEEGATAGARSVVPLHDRLSAAVRQDVELALKGDRQLGEQIAQILSAHRFDNETRAQVVRLINDRAQQLVPSAARRVINEWTQTTLSAHRAKSGKSDAASRADIEPALAQSNVPQGASSAASPQRRGKGSQSPDLNRGAASSAARRVDYRKLSDEQILDL